MADIAARGSRGTKFFALAAGGALVVGGLGYTLASWTDTEWVFGGNAGNGTPGMSTSTFEVEQNVSVPYDAAAFLQNETDPGQGLQFSLSALALSPGDATYAPVVLRTTTDSLAGDVTLQPAVPATGLAVTDAEQTLWNALHVRAATTTDASAACDASAFTPATIVADGALGTTGGSTTQHLQGDGGSTQEYCFEVSLPANPVLPAGVSIADLQGRSAAPAWQFAAESD